MLVVNRLHVIGCGVMQIDLTAAARELGIVVTSDYLEAGLHDQPGELKRQLQAAVDRVSAAGECDRIVIAYGICGRGLVGIKAGAVPLAVPKVHDCIAMFLGSDAAYRQQFAHCPGTFYISAGWFEKKVQPKGGRSRKIQGPLPDADLPRLSRKYGDDNARAIVDFLGSWRKNYKRAVFIDTGAGDQERYAEYARAMAEEFGWEYERMPGDWSLLRAMLQAEETTAEVLIVPPGQVIQYDPLASGINAAPPNGRRGKARGGASTIAAGGGQRAATTRLGLGIDAGGTYTDVAIYEFATNAVLSKGKALTTKWDYTQGIAEALDKLDPAWLPRVDLVAVSTTLATNAIVEGQGQKVGLLTMPPGGHLPAGALNHRPVATIAGQMDIVGQELQPVDPEEVRRVAGQMIARDQVEVFAVSGYASTRNASHELAVKAILQESFGTDVVCGHELSDQLDFKVRANTAALNARIIPLLTRFIDDVGRALSERRIGAQMVIVKGDGTLMSSEVARRRPIETILSGPAASVAGARYLTRLPEATVVDMGGTTSDLARVRDGKVAISRSGSRVGGWQTHVQALDMQTIGLGGDSAIVHRKLALGIGPQRIAPISWLAAREPATAAALDFLDAHLGDYIVDSEPMQIMLRTPHRSPFRPSAEEQRILDALANGPLTLVQLADRSGMQHWKLLDTKRLENHHLIQRCGLTPTDILHAAGEIALWDRAAADRLVAMTAMLACLEPDQFVALVRRRIEETLAELLLKRQLDHLADPDALDRCEVCRELMSNLHADGNRDYAVAIALRQPIVGLGAPIHYFLPAAARRLQAEMVIPEHADVANAVGAITSWVTVNRRLHIQPSETGGFLLHGLPAVLAFRNIDAAHEHAVDWLTREVRQLARAAGTSHDDIALHIDDRIAAAADGTEIFLERILHAEISGPPDAVRLAELSA